MMRAFVLSFCLSSLLPLRAEAANRDKGKAAAGARKADKPAPRKPSETAAKPPASGGGRTEVLDDGTRVKAYSFGTMDLEGKLKTPQLLYFLGRVKAELDSTTDARRSFVKELKDTGHEKGL